MKKIFLTILFTLVLSGGASTNEIYRWTANAGDYDENQFKKKNEHIIRGNSSSRISKQDVINKTLAACAKRFTNPEDANCIIRDIQYWKKGAFGLPKKVKDEYLWDQEVQKLLARRSQEKTIENKKAQEQQQETIMFTIKDKREQCEAIGFKPETEKFADCVLRLVELDVKQQTQNQIATAQNNGNDALAKQLKRQNNLQSSQALINLGQQLMNPKRYNSNIYMPQTQRCTIQGFGSFANMICR